MSLTPRRLFTALLFIALVVMATREITDPDFWWHLRTGEYIVETATIPHADVFSLTNAGQPWVTHEWLTQVVFYLLFRLGSFPALIITFAAVIAAALAFVYARCPGKPYVAAAAVLLAALASAVTWGVRPQMVSLLFTSIYLWVLDSADAQGKRRRLWILIPLMLLWVNMHSGYALGIAILSIYAFGAAIHHIRQSGWRIPDRRSPLVSLAIVLVLCIAVVPLNPNGFTMFVYPFGTLFSGAMQTYIQEWFSPDFHSIQFQPFAWLLLATLGAISISGKRPSLVEILLLLGSAYAGLSSARNIPIFALVAAPLLADSLWSFIVERGWTGHVESRLRVTRGMVLVNWLLLAGLGLAAVSRIVMVVQNQPASEQTRYPAAAVDYIISHQLTGPIYNAYGWGGYLIWRLYPKQRVFIDGRADVYGDAFINRYLAAWRGDAGWQALLDQYKVNTILIERDAPLTSRLDQDAAWNRVYSDSLAAIYTSSAP